MLEWQTGSTKDAVFYERVGSSPIFRIVKKKDSNEKSFGSFLFQKRERALNPVDSRSPLRFGQRRTDVPWTSCTPSSAQNRKAITQSTCLFFVEESLEPGIQGLCFASVGAEQTSPRRLAPHLQWYKLIREKTLDSKSEGFICLHN